MTELEILLASIGVGTITVITLFLVLLAILWFCLPFAVFGTKRLLRDILTTQRKILKELQAQSEQEDVAAPVPGVPAREVISSPHDIVTCVTCGRETYGGQDNCPHCGQPLRVAPKIGSPDVVF